ncbi:MAG: formate dehydrogenase accessory sulfurtransferase FdhD [Myxococcus sp.]|nr:formate dehydrogenase accessory sulfurtransferase FdhD [Myxococcus sp.]
MSRVELDAVAFAFDGADAPRPRDVAVEAPVNVVYGARPYAVMMTTPADLEDFAYGFTVTEGVVTDAAFIKGVQVLERARGVELVVTLRADAPRHPLRERSLSGRTGCGLCGVTSLEQLPMVKAQGLAGVDVSLPAVRAALAALEAQQPLNGLTRAVHAAAWCSAGGTLEQVREDVGRHNALDKLIGARLRAGLPPGEGFLLLTSRCSYELVDKAAAYGARTIVTISAPTSFAVERARAHDMTLLAVARRDGVLAFHGAERVRRA